MRWLELSDMASPSRARRAQWPAERIQWVPQPRKPFARHPIGYQPGTGCQLAQNLQAATQRLTYRIARILHHNVYRIALQRHCPLAPSTFTHQFPLCPSNYPSPSAQALLPPHPCAEELFVPLGELFQSECGYQRLSTLAHTPPASSSHSICHCTFTWRVASPRIDLRARGLDTLLLIRLISKVGVPGQPRAVQVPFLFQNSHDKRSTTVHDDHSKQRRRASIEDSSPDPQRT
ncbi:hypothetical protein BX600DRAFT_539504 [Xylariales sp. PMI_506]|nr:hypothetical protein BX600DRAFT_539504 [Xylariales sp. PMI_506]